MKSRFSENDILKVLDLYKEGKFPAEIALLMNRGKTSILRHLKANGIIVDRSLSKATYTLNRMYFDDINSPDKAYFLGILWADGTNKVSENTVKIALKKSDEKLLEKLRDLIEHTRPLSYYEDKRENKEVTAELIIYNKYISEVLASYGMIQNKTFLTSFPEVVPENFKKDFIRGYFDGDGSIISHVTPKNYIKDCATFTGTLELLTDIEKELNKLKIHCSWYTRHPERSNNIRTISISGRLNCSKLMDYMYEDNVELYMERKYNKFYKLKNRYENK